MSTNLNARHRRHVERARKQGRADGPDTIARMATVAAMARVQRLEVEQCRHQRQTFTTIGGFVCLGCGVTL